MASKFKLFHKHCTACKRGRPCGKSHVYALILDLDILDNDWFREANPDYIDGKSCFYVGRTSKHVPKCRASGHQYCKVGKWKGKKFQCYCNGKGALVECTYGSRASPKVDRYNTYRLRGGLFKKYNPQEDVDANKQAEKDLAKDLRSKGYGVWAGHLDSRAAESGEDSGLPANELALNPPRERHYCRKANSIKSGKTNFFLAWAKSRIEHYRRLYGDDFRLIFYRDIHPYDYYSIPYALIRDSIPESHMDKRQRWCGYIDEGVLKVTRRPHEMATLDISVYFNCHEEKEAEFRDETVSEPPENQIPDWVTKRLNDADN